MTTPMRLPRIQDLTPDTVKRGRGYFIGELAEKSEMLPYLKPGVLIGQFDSVPAYLAALEEQNYKPEQDKQSDQSAQRGDEFNAFQSLAEAKDIFRNDPKSIRKFKAEDLRLKAEENIGKEIRFDVVGDYIDIGRFLEGQPECFGLSYMGNPAGLYTTIIINTVAIYHVSQDAMNVKQARILRLVDWMESQGIRCRIIAMDSRDCSHVEVTVKNFGDAVDMNQIAVAGHSEFLRRIGFLFSEQSKTWGWGYGNAIEATTWMMKNFRANRDDGLTVFLGHSSHNDIPRIEKQFDELRDKIELVIDAPAEQRDFDTVYAVEL